MKEEDAERIKIGDKESLKKKKKGKIVVENNLLNNLEEAPPSYEQKDNIHYNCTECSSMIEILEINKEIIKFKCLKNKH